jgi:choline kinase
LIDETLKRLGTDKPVVYVPEELFHDFSKIFLNRYNFEITNIYNNLYRKGLKAV